MSDNRVSVQGFFQTERPETDAVRLSDSGTCTVSFGGITLFFKDTDTAESVLMEALREVRSV